MKTRSKWREWQGEEEECRGCQEMGVSRRKTTSPWKQRGVSERAWVMDSEEHGVTSGKLGELCKSQFLLHIKSRH